MNILPLPLFNKPTIAPSRSTSRSIWQPKFRAFRGLPLDFWLEVSRFLPNQDILNLSNCCKYFREILYKVEFTDEVMIDNIVDLPYFDSFVNVKYNSVAKFPAKLRFLNWNCEANFQHTLPDTLIGIKFGYNFCRSLPPIPDHITHLKFGYKSTQRISGNLPKKLVYLKLGPWFHESLPRLPNTLKYLILRNYRKQLPALPDSLISLELGNDYKQSLPPLPKSLISLKVGNYYDQVLSSLPKSLKYLSLGDNYDCRDDISSYYETIGSCHYFPPLRFSQLQEPEMEEVD